MVYLLQDVILLKLVHSDFCNGNNILTKNSILIKIIIFNDNFFGRKE